MAYRKPKQSPGYKGTNNLPWQGRSRQTSKTRHDTKELATASGMPEARVSRILRGGKVRLTEQDINQLALGLRKTTAERDNLRYLAWPELYEIDKALKRRNGCVFLLNYELAEQDFLIGE